MDAQAELERLRAELATERASSTYARAELERLRAELATDRASSTDMQTELERLHSELATDRASSTDMQTELERLHSELATERASSTETQAELERLRAELDGAGASAGEVQVEIERLRAELDSARAASAEAVSEIERLAGEHAAGRAQAAEAPAEVEPVAVEPAAAQPEVAPRVGVAPSALLAVQRKVTAKIAAATSMDTALRVTLAELGGEAGWDVAVGWLPDRSGTRLRPAAVWCSPALAGTQFETQSWQATIDEGPQAIARTWETREPAWVDAFDSESERARVRWAHAAGLSAAAAVPIADGDSSRGLLELYRREPGPRDEDMLEVLSTVGVQLAGAARLLELASKPRWR
jgi:archaellum component FlaC